MKSAQELIEIIVQNDLLKPLFDDNFYDFEVGDKDGNDIEDIREYIKKFGLGELEYKDSREDTSEFWQVIYFKDHDIYLRIEGEYDSYMDYNHEYNTVIEVKAKEITTIIYE